MQLATHATSVEGQHGAMMRQLGEYTARLRATAAQNEALQAEIVQLRAFIQVRRPAGVRAYCACDAQR